MAASPYIKLQELTAQNWKECASLSHPDDAYIKSNLYSIAEAQFYPKFKSQAIYRRKILVGYTMYGMSAENVNICHIERFMIGKQFRRVGYAQAAMRLIINEASEEGFHMIRATTKPANEAMTKLLVKMEFTTNLQMVNDEIFYTYIINRPQ